MTQKVIRKVATAAETLTNRFNKAKDSFINLNDDLATITRKLASTPTDSGQGKINLLPKTKDAKTSVNDKQYLDQQTNQESHGVASLLQFVKLFEGEKKMSHYEALYQGEGIKYAQLKQDLAQAIYQDLEPMQIKRKELEAKPEYVDQVIAQGAAKARAIADEL